MMSAYDCLPVHMYVQTLGKGEGRLSKGGEGIARNALLANATLHV